MIVHYKKTCFLIVAVEIDPVAMGENKSGAQRESYKIYTNIGECNKGTRDPTYVAVQSFSIARHREISLRLYDKRQP